jgi:hypothetical protein
MMLKLLKCGTAAVLLSAGAAAAAPVGAASFFANYVLTTDGDASDTVTLGDTIEISGLGLGEGSGAFADFKGTISPFSLFLSADLLTNNDGDGFTFGRYQIDLEETQASKTLGSLAILSTGTVSGPGLSLTSATLNLTIPGDKPFGPAAGRIHAGASPVDPAAVPLPAGGLLLIGGLGAIALLRRRGDGARA